MATQSTASMANGTSKVRPLHDCHIHTFQATLTKLFAFFYSILLFSILTFRVSPFSKSTPLLPWLLVFSSELLLSFLSLLNLSFRWRPASRTASPVRPSDLADPLLPAIDVFVFTADPEREPALEVMNTVISAMALDYPPEKLAVYISDDGASEVTLAAAEEAAEFAKWWIPFCRRYEIRVRCPKTYFRGDGEKGNAGGGGGGGGGFVVERRTMEERYEVFKDRVKRFRQSDVTTGPSRPAVIKIINSIFKDAKEPEIPRLIYVAREKSPSHPSHFKAGAVNTLLRVSSILTNAPYILMLDCDMYSNDPSSARQAMCFLLDQEISSSLAFVQFPQKFHNVAPNDIYGSRLRTTFDIKWPGMNGLKGPMVSGTCFYMKRRALYGSMAVESADFSQLKLHFGPSNDLIKSLQHENHIKMTDDQLHLLLSEAKFLSSCTYELNTSWGQEIGFLYGSVVEDYFTGFMLHCKGWNSIYVDPPKPAFLGTGVTNLSDALVQNTRWQSGLIDVTLSRHFPLVYGSRRMSLVQSLCYASLGLQPFYALPIWCLATIPQLCLIHGIAIYPKALSPWFKVFLACFLAPKLKYLQDILSTGGSFQDYWNEDRMWMTRSLTSYFYGITDALLKKAGLRQASFIPTNKVEGDENINLYKMGKFNFQLPPMFLVPLLLVAFLNGIGFVVGVGRVAIKGRDWDEMMGQILLSGYVSVSSYPVFEGVFLRRDKGRVRVSVGMVRSLLCIGGLVLGSGLVLWV